MRFTTHLEGFALRASARSKDRAKDTSSPQSTGDRHSMCAIRATATLTTTTKKERERERETIDFFDVILILERAVLLVLFSVFVAL